MRNEKIKELQHDVRRTEEKLDNLLKSLGSLEDERARAFDVSVPIPSTDSSVSDIRARHAAVAGLVNKLDGNGSTIAPLSFFNGTANALRSIVNSIDQIEAEIATIKSWGGLKSFDNEKFTASCKNGNDRELSGPFKTFFDNSESYLSEFFHIFNGINPSRASFNFTSAASSLSKVISRSTNTRNELSATLAKAKSLLSEIEEGSQSVDGAVKRSNDGAAAVAESQGRAGEEFGKLQSVVERVSTISDEAEKLSAAVSEYGEKFEKFDQDMEVREGTYKKGLENLDNLTNNFIEQKSYIGAIIEQSDNMLSGATVAGLSSEFKKLRDDLSVQVKDAETTFNLSIAFLFVSAIPLIIFIFTPILAPMIFNNQTILDAVASAGSEKSGWQYVGQVIGRFIILLPAIWFVTFATARYNSLFKLREHYSYKYSMAFAVDGFKKQAPGHEEMIAALVFEQLAFNPADKMGKQPEGPESPPNPIARLLLERLRSSKSGPDET